MFARCSLIIFALIVVITLAYSPIVAQTTGSDSVVDENTAVRFFFIPPLSYAHPPLVLRNVSAKDNRLNSAPMLDEGRVAYISSGEMQLIIKKLLRSILLWSKSKRVESLKPIQDLAVRDKMEIKIFTSGGTEQTLVMQKNICKVLAPLDSVITQPRALWELKLYRHEYGCVVRNFDRDAYLQHYEGR